VGKGHLRRVPWLVRPRGKWTEEGVSGFEELAKAASPMCVGKDGMKGEVAAYKEASPRYGELAALMDDVPRVVEASAMRACGVVRGGGTVTE
jgi:hypothetical protein